MAVTLEGNGVVPPPIPTPLPIPVPEPVPTPIDPCLTSPLTITNLRWPANTAGASRLDYRTNYPEVTVVVTLGSPTTITITDRRGCRATVTK